MLILTAVWLVLIPLFLGLFRSMIDDDATHAVAGGVWPVTVTVLLIFYVCEGIADLVRWIYHLGERAGKKLS